MGLPERPAFRHLDMHRIEEGEERGVALVDPIGLVESAFIPEGMLPVVALFDGQRSIAEIESELRAAHGDQVPDGYVRDLVQQLDERLLLLSPRYEAALSEEASRFAGGEAREARHAGSAGYPAEPTRLTEALGSMVPTGRATSRPSPRGLVAPHIDLARGREGYAQAYGYLAECEPADLYVVFGTGHQGPASVVTGLSMDWDTPIGRVRTDREFVAAVHDRLEPPHPLDVLLHRQEHSLEFQMLFLRHVLGPRDFAVAGFLTGGMHDEDEVAATLEAIRAEAAATDRSVCYVAGADLAHLGPFFGDPHPIDRARLDALHAAETQRLAHLENGDPVAFRHSIENPGNPDRVCGTTPMYLTAQLAGGPAERLYYGQADASDGSQVVSYCAMAFG